MAGAVCKAALALSLPLLASLDASPPDQLSVQKLREQRIPLSLDSSSSLALLASHARLPTHVLVFLGHSSFISSLRLFSLTSGEAALDQRLGSTRETRCSIDN